MQHTHVDLMALAALLVPAAIVFLVLRPTKSKHKPGEPEPPEPEEFDSDWGRW